MTYLSCQDCNHFSHDPGYHRDSNGDGCPPSVECINNTEPTEELSRFWEGGWPENEETGEQETCPGFESTEVEFEAV